MVTYVSHFLPISQSIKLPVTRSTPDTRTSSSLSPSHLILLASESQRNLIATYLPHIESSFQHHARNQLTERRISMAHPATPPPSDPGSDDSHTPDSLISVRRFPPSPLSSQLSTPCASPHPHRSIFHIPRTLTQETVNATPQLKRLQQDLLLLTSFPDNTTLSWRPSWFAAPSSPSAHWTLHNPPDVVTEVLPRSDGTGPSKIMTRRLRKGHDEGARWMRTNGDWERYCDLYGVPYDFLNEDQVRLMKMGLPMREGTPCGMYMLEVVFCKAGELTYT